MKLEINELRKTIKLLEPLTFKNYETLSTVKRAFWKFEVIDYKEKEIYGEGLPISNPYIEKIEKPIKYTRRETVPYVKYDKEVQRWLEELNKHIPSKMDKSQGTELWNDLYNFKAKYL